MSYTRKGPPEVPPEQQNLLDYVMKELEELERTFRGLETIRLKKLYVAPKRPRDGDIALADGTTWNPGSGAGFYGYYGGSWHKF